jgi:hypothetical protein
MRVKVAGRLPLAVTLSVKLPACGLSSTALTWILVTSVRLNSALKMSVALALICAGVMVAASRDSIRPVASSAAYIDARAADCAAVVDRCAREPDDRTIASANIGATPPLWSAKNRDRMALSPWKVGGARVPCRFYRSVTTASELLLKFDKTFAMRTETTRMAAPALSALCCRRIRTLHRVGKRHIALIAEKHLSRRKGWNFMARST